MYDKSITSRYIFHFLLASAFFLFFFVCAMLTFPHFKNLIAYRTELFMRIVCFRSHHFNILFSVFYFLFVFYFYISRTLSKYTRKIFKVLTIWKISFHFTQTIAVTPSHTETRRRETQNHSQSYWSCLFNIIKDNSWEYYLLVRTLRTIRLTHPTLYARENYNFDNYKKPIDKLPLQNESVRGSMSMVHQNHNRL